MILKEINQLSLQIPAESGKIRNRDANNLPALPPDGKPLAEQCGNRARSCPYCGRLVRNNRGPLGPEPNQNIACSWLALSFLTLSITVQHGIRQVLWPRCGLRPEEPTRCRPDWVITVAVFVWVIRGRGNLLILSLAGRGGRRHRLVVFHFGSMSIE